MQLYATRRSDSGTIARIELFATPFGTLIRRHLVTGRYIDVTSPLPPDEWAERNSRVNRTQEWKLA